jgi:hypothetical protein
MSFDPAALIAKRCLIFLKATASNYLLTVDFMTKLIDRGLPYLLHQPALYVAIHS